MFHRFIERASATAYLVLTLAAISAPASGQAERKDASECAKIMEGLQPGASAAALQRELQGVGECPARGPVALARVWEAPPSDTTVLEMLSGATVSIRDSRVIPAVVKTVENASMPRPIRLAALSTLVGLYSPDHRVIFKQRAGEDANGPVYALVGEWTHPMGRDGASPVTPADRDQLLAVLTRISQSDADPGFRHAAQQVMVRLGSGTH